MGKYAKIIDQLPKMAGEEPEYQRKIDAIKKDIVAKQEHPLHASTLAKMYLDLRRGDGDRLVPADRRQQLIDEFGKEGLEELLYECNMQMTAIEQMLVDQYELEDTDSIRLDTGFTVAVQREPYAQVQGREEFRQWCIDEGLENLFMLPWMTTNKITKERLLDGQPEPPGVKAFTRSKIVLRNPR